MANGIQWRKLAGKPATIPTYCLLCGIMRRLKNRVETRRRVGGSTQPCGQTAVIVLTDIKVDRSIKPATAGIELNALNGRLDCGLLHDRNVLKRRPCSE